MYKNVPHNYIIKRPGPQTPDKNRPIHTDMIDDVVLLLCWFIGKGWDAPDEKLTQGKDKG